MSEAGVLVQAAKQSLRLPRLRAEALQRAGTSLTLLAMTPFGLSR
jgi:hypothetical protein